MQHKVSCTKKSENASKGGKGETEQQNLREKLQIKHYTENKCVDEQVAGHRQTHVRTQMNSYLHFLWLCLQEKLKQTAEFIVCKEITKLILIAMFLLLDFFPCATETFLFISLLIYCCCFGLKTGEHANATMKIWRWEGFGVERERPSAVVRSLTKE